MTSLQNQPRHSVQIKRLSGQEEGLNRNTDPETTDGFINRAFSKMEESSLEIVDVENEGSIEEVQVNASPENLPSKKFSRGFNVKRFCLLGFALIETLLFGGIIFGWPAMAFVFKSSGYFLHLCPLADNSTTAEPLRETCDKQDALISLVFTVGTFSLLGCVFFGGVVFDRFGTRILRLIVNTCISIGLLLMSLSSSDNPFLLFPALALVSVGGILILVSNLQVGNLFGRKRGTVVTLISGTYDSSTIVMFILKLIYDSGVNVKIPLFILTGVSLLIFVNTMFLMPSDYIPWPLPEDYNMSKYKRGQVKETSSKPEMDINEESITKKHCISQNGTDATFQESISRGETNSEKRQSIIERTKKADYPTLKSCISSPVFFGYVAWFTVLNLRNVFFLARYNPWITQMTDDDENLVSQYTTIFSFIQCTGIFFSPFNGLLYDRNKNKHKNSPVVDPFSDMQDALLPIILVITLWLIFSVDVLIPILPLHFFTFVFQVMIRTFFYGSAALLSSILWPVEYLGTCFGLCASIAGVISVAQFPLFILVQEIFDDYQAPVDVLFIFLVGVTYVFPLSIYIFIRKKRKQTIHHPNDERVR